MREFKYYPADFKELAFDVEHYDLIFDVYDDHTHVDSHVHLKTKEPIKSITLNAKNLEIHSISCKEFTCTYNYRKDDDLIDITFEQEIPAQTTMTLHTESTCKPTKNILEGLYYDETPKGCPCQQITQCQQWGFQRIVPSVDEMIAKCTYNTTIRARKEYTNIITNGDQTCQPVDIGEDRVEVTYENTITPMATYLFFMGVGTYATFTKELTYPDGKKIMLELLVPPDAPEEIAQQSLDILYDAVMWVHLYTGPDCYQNKREADRIWKLLHEQNRTGTSAAIQELYEGKTWGYKYTGKVYREIGMQNSDYGGMENVGNTTITTNRIMPYPHMGDNGYMYMMRVKTHEFYHNLNGSEVTGWSPFEIWLNEAVTVHIERKNYAFIFGEDFSRLDEVQDIIAPNSGILDMDANPGALPIQPEGFNDPNELISSITYIKAPEFIRMLEVLMGEEKFAQALHTYHTKFKHSNAKWTEWVDIMQEVSGIPLENMAKAWLMQRGWPQVEVKKEYKEGQLTINITQSSTSNTIYEFPLDIAVFDKDNNVIDQRILHIKEKQTSYTIQTNEVGFLSINRGLSCFTRVVYDASEQELLQQVYHDTDVVNKYIAFNTLIAHERLHLLKEPARKVDQKIITLFMDMLRDKELMEKAGGQFTSYLKTVLDPSFTHKYEDLYQVDKRIDSAIAQEHKQELLELYTSIASKVYPGGPIESRNASIKERQIKNTALHLLATLDTEDIHTIIKKQLEESTNATDKMLALRLYLKSNAADKYQVLDAYKGEAKENLVKWEAFLQAIGSNQADDAEQLIEKMQTDPSFRIEQANDHRALLTIYCHNRRKSMLTQKGRALFKKIILELATVNEYGAINAIESYATVHFLDQEHKEACMQVLNELLESIDEKQFPMITGKIKRIIKS